MNKKLVYISNSTIPSRSANSIHVMKMCNAFSQNGYSVTLISPDRENEYEDIDGSVFDFYSIPERFSIERVKTTNIKYLNLIHYAFLSFLKIRKINPNIVYGRDLYGCLIASYQYETIFEIHSPMSNAVTRYLLGKMNKNKHYKYNVVISNALKNIILKVQKIYGKDIVVAQDGADEVIDFNNKISLKGSLDALKVGYTGHLYRGRGVNIIMECAGLLKDVTFHIVGGLDEDIQHWRQKTKKIDNVYIYGFVPPLNAIQYRNSVDILLAPYSNQVASFSDSMDTTAFMSPLKIFEYMSHGKAIIASDLPALKEVLNCNNSILVKCNNVEQWADSIEKLKDESLRRKVASAALKDFKKYSWRNRVLKVLDLH